jgi:hypothetical protein
VRGCKRTSEGQARTRAPRPESPAGRSLREVEAEAVALGDGRVHDDDGYPVLDSPLHNACAHFVHNAFYILGDANDPHISPSEVQAEL